MSSLPGRDGVAERYAVAWHEAECGGYEIDLPTWIALAGQPPKRILDLGCGSGRVARTLAAAGHEVTGLDQDPRLLAALARGNAGIVAVQADARHFSLEGAFDLILAPMQLLQLFLTEADRAACLRCADDHLKPGGLFAAAILDLDPGTLPSNEDLLADQPITPDRYSISANELALSTPLRFQIDDQDVLHLNRMRQVRRGVISTEVGRIVAEEIAAEQVVAEETICHSLKLLSPAQVEVELSAAGFGAVQWRQLPESETHMGSLVAVAERGE